MVNPETQCDGVWKWRFGEMVKSRGLSRLVLLQKKPPESSLTSSTVREHSEKAKQELGCGLSTDTKSASMVP